MKIEDEIEQGLKYVREKLTQQLVDGTAGRRETADLALAALALVAAREREFKGETRRYEARISASRASKRRTRSLVFYLLNANSPLFADSLLERKATTAGRACVYM